MRKQKLTSDARWKDTVINTRMKVRRIYSFTLRPSRIYSRCFAYVEMFVFGIKVGNNAAEDVDKNDPKSRWRRGVFLAGRLRDGNAIFSNEDDTKSGVKHQPEFTKELTTQHWLELVDP